jgi:hypothetical protein
MPDRDFLSGDGGRILSATSQFSEIQACAESWISAGKNDYIYQIVGISAGKSVTYRGNQLSTECVA